MDFTGTVSVSHPLLCRHSYLPIRTEQLSEQAEGKEEREKGKNENRPSRENMLDYINHILSFKMAF